MKNLKYTPENKDMVNKGKKTEITTREVTKGQKKVRKNVLVRSEKIWKKGPKIKKKRHF